MNLSSLSSLTKRVVKLEKSATADVTLFLMPDNTVVSLTGEQRRQGMSDAVFGVVDSFEGGIMLNAVRSNDGSGILPLILAVVNPQNTEEPNEMEGRVE